MKDFSAVLAVIMPATWTSGTASSDRDRRTGDGFEVNKDRLNHPQERHVPPEPAEAPDTIQVSWREAQAHAEADVQRLSTQQDA